MIKSQDFHKLVLLEIEYFSLILQSTQYIMHMCLPGVHVHMTHEQYLLNSKIVYLQYMYMYMYCPKGCILVHWWWGGAWAPPPLQFSSQLIYSNTRLDLYLS